LTGLVILSSGVWAQKVDNQFQNTDLSVLAGKYDESKPSDQEKLAGFLLGKSGLPLFSGEIEVIDGELAADVTVLHSRSVAEDVRVTKSGSLYSGKLRVLNGNIPVAEQVELRGSSLIHSAPLTTEAFTKSWFGPWGRYIVAVGLLLFAFSTAISWSYYGGRAVTFLFGVKGEIYYRVVYVTCFFFASFTDTTVIWTFSGITIAMMTIPNLIGILMLRKEMKSEVKAFWKEYTVFFGEGKKSIK
jgi:AGCS family alanine or glycine:cation symporter